MKWKAKKKESEQQPFQHLYTPRYPQKHLWTLINVISRIQMKNEDIVAIYSN